MNPEFYSKVATRFGGYSSGAKRTTLYPEGDPEALFDQITTGLGGSEARLLDVGCADGRNLLAIAPSFAHVHAIDLAPQMLESAELSLAASGLHHVEFSLRDASATGFPDGSFDVITSRRGPLFPEEFHRLLRPGGAVVHLGIGEQDVRALKELFGRGQLYRRWEGAPVSQEERARLERAGFTVLREQSVPYLEYFHSAAELDRFLQAVPIFEDYDQERDREPFDRYVEAASEERGILMDRHWFVLHARRGDR
ncbi:class I SAM-dependent methyltransferase [Streptomyces sp. NBC_01217]|uniref:class I SAM-dependent methyltransferase n=1 Tax=Streptomyces sp. NBC_01217 TaxID=2903779 RepID=UPI002E10CF26|nr:methyltransferase domain-containing protein [Streptomyces sp. NBC_01217]